MIKIFVLKIVLCWVNFFINIDKINKKKKGEGVKNKNPTHVLLTLLLAGRGQFNPPPLGFFQKAGKRVEIWTNKKISVNQIHFLRFKKKIACNLVQPFSHSNYAVNMGRGGQIDPSPHLSSRLHGRGGQFDSPPL